jgi:hypothetical protein
MSTCGFRAIAVLVTLPCGLQVFGARMLQTLTNQIYLRTRCDPVLPWIGAVGLAIVIGITYLFAARLSLALLAGSDGVALFPRAYPPTSLPRSGAP